MLCNAMWIFKMPLKGHEIWQHWARTLSFCPLGKLRRGVLKTFQVPPAKCLLFHLQYLTGPSRLLSWQPLFGRASCSLRQAKNKYLRSPFSYPHVVSSQHLFTPTAFAFPWARWRFPSHPCCWHLPRICKFL